MIARLLALGVALSLVCGPLAARPSAQDLGAVVEGFAKEHDFSGTVLVEQGPRRLYARSFGLADRAFGVPVSSATRFRIGSITKLFTAVLVLQLEEEGKLSLEAPVRQYLPDFPGEGGDAITLGQLLNHTSGLAQYDDVGSYQEAFARGVPKYQRPVPPAELLALCCSGKLAARPGSRFDYNNADYFVLGRIVERVTGMSYEEALAQRILRPLGLRDTGMVHWSAIVDRLAPTYFYRDDSRTLINDMPVYHENWYAAAGLYSTGGDLLRFAQALYGGRLLGPTALRRMLTPGLDDYGYGLWSYTIERGGRKYRVAKRPGSVMGANGVLYRLLDRDTTIVILANTNRADLDVFAQKVADALVK